MLPQSCLTQQLSLEFCRFSWPGSGAATLIIRLCLCVWVCARVFVVLFQVFCQDWCVYISWRPERAEVPSFITMRGVCVWVRACGGRGSPQIPRAALICCIDKHRGDRSQTCCRSVNAAVGAWRKRAQMRRFGVRREDLLRELVRASSVSKLQ